MHSYSVFAILAGLAGVHTSVAHPMETRQVALSSPKETLSIPAQVTRTRRYFDRSGSESTTAEESSCLTGVERVVWDGFTKRLKLEQGPVVNCQTGKQVPGLGGFTTLFDGVHMTAQEYRQEPGSVQCAEYKAKELIFMPEMSFVATSMVNGTVAELYENGDHPSFPIQLTVHAWTKQWLSMDIPKVHVQVLSYQEQVDPREFSTPRHVECKTMPQLFHGSGKQVTSPWMIVPLAQRRAMKA